MSEADNTAAPATAGRLLREARQAQGIHLAALASTIKVAPRKLELLEADRLDELPDATFTRALAQTVCRALKIDPAPVLALLPRPDASRLAHVGDGLNTPFRAAGASGLGDDDAPWLRPAIWGPALLLVVAGAVYLLPAGWLPAPPWREPASAETRDTAARRAATMSSTASMPSVIEVAASPASDPGVASAPAGISASDGAASAPAAMSNVDAAASAPSASPPSGPPSVVAATNATTTTSATNATNATNAASPLDAASASAPAQPDTEHALVLQASGDSWIEVVDARGKPLLSRTVKAGESVALDGALPLRLRIGNAPATAVIFRGRPVALAPYTRDNLARLELR